MSSVDEKLAALRARGGHPAIVYPRLWNPAFKLRPYQEVGALHLLCKKYFILGDPTGTGKTPQSLYAWAAINDDRPVPLIVVTTSSAPGQWAEGIEKFLLNPTIRYCRKTSPTKKQRLKVVQEWLDECQNPVGPVLIITWGILQQDWAAMQPMLSAVLPRTQVIFDECQKIKNPASSIHQKAKNLARSADRVHALTATLVKNTAHDAHGIISALIPGMMSLSYFENTYCEWAYESQICKGRGYQKVRVLKNYHKLDEFRKTLDPFYLVRGDEALDGERPEVQHIERKLLMKPKHRELYLDTEAGIFTELDDQGNPNYGAAIAHAQIVASAPEASLRYITDQDVLTHESFEAMSQYNTKLEALMELLDNELLDRPVVIYSPFERVVSCYAHHLRHFNPVRVTGKEGSEERDRARRSFTNGDSNVIFLTDAGGEALNLQRARDLIFLSRPWDVGRYVQVVGRIRRFGSAYQRINIWHLTCEDSIDELVDGVVAEKFGPYDQIVGGRGNLIPDQHIIPAEIARRLLRRRRGSRQISTPQSHLPH